MPHETYAKISKTIKPNQVLNYIKSPTLNEFKTSHAKNTS